MHSSSCSFHCLNSVKELNLSCCVPVNQWYWRMTPLFTCLQLYQDFSYAPFHYVAIDVSLSCTALGIEKDRENVVPEGSSSHVHLNEYVWNMCTHSGGTERLSEVDLYTEPRHVLYIIDI